MTGASNATKNPSQFLFVACNGPNGRHQDHNRALVRSHISLQSQSSNPSISSTSSIKPRLDNYVSKWSLPLYQAQQSQQSSDEDRTQPLHLGETTDSDETLVEELIEKRRKKGRKLLKNSKALSTQDKKRQLRAEENARIAIPNITLASADKTLDKVCMLLFGAQPDDRYRVAKANWAQAGWDIGRKDSLFREGLHLFAFHRQTQLGGSRVEYFQQVVRLVNLIQSKLADDFKDAASLVAVGMLAYCALLDRDVQTAHVHLDALKRLGTKDSFKHAKQEWLYVAWVDLKYSVLAKTEPSLTYSIPLAYQFELETDPAAEELISKIMRTFPRNLTATTEELHRLLQELFQLQRQVSDPNAQAEPIYGLIYDLEYHIRVWDARHRGRSSIGITDSVLLLTAIQVSIWILSRFYAPFSQFFRRWVLLQSCLVVSSQTSIDPLEQNEWRIWALTMLYSCAFEVDIPKSNISLGDLNDLLDAHGIHDYQSFMDTTAIWPCAEDWHLVKHDLLWKELSRARCVSQTSEPEALKWSTGKQYYVGPIEFYGD